MNARELMKKLLVHLPAAATVEAGAASYSWLRAGATDEPSAPPIVAGLVVTERSDLPPNLIVISDIGGRALATIDVTEIDDPADSEP